MQEAYALVRERCQAEHKRQKELYDQKVHRKPFSPGELVWLHSTAVPRGRSRKLHHPWKGPFKVMERLGETTYKIKNLQGRRKTTFVHFDRLKPCVISDDKPENTGSREQEPVGTNLDLVDSDDDDPVQQEEAAVPEIANPPVPPLNEQRRYPVPHVGFASLFRIVSVAIMQFDMTNTQGPLPCKQSTGLSCPNALCPNTSVTYTCDISNALGTSHWAFPSGTCASNAIELDEIALLHCATQVGRCGPFTASNVASRNGACTTTIISFFATNQLNGTRLTCLTVGGAYSNTIGYATILLAAQPQPPVVSVSSSLNSIALKVNANEDGITVYNATVLSSTFFASVTIANGTAFVINELPSNTNFTINVTANRCGWSSVPSTVTICTLATPPDDIRVFCDTSNVVLVIWTHVENVGAAISVNISSSCQHLNGTNEGIRTQNNCTPSTPVSCKYEITITAILCSFFSLILGTVISSALCLLFKHNSMSCKIVKPNTHSGASNIHPNTTQSELAIPLQENEVYEVVKNKE
ncbi:hypothetical protein EMCRGX_G022851 [Ephydatia muelleri]